MEIIDDTKPIKIFRLDDGYIEYFVTNTETWGDFDLIVENIIKYFDVEVNNEIDGIFTRTWVFSYKNETFMLKHDDDYGNYFLVKKNTNENLLVDIIDFFNNKLEK